jgi:hypothetical protein
MAWTLSNCLPPLRFATGCHQRLRVSSPAKADDPRDHPSDCARITLPFPPCTLWGPGDESHLLSHPLGVRSLTWGMASVALLTGDTTAGQAAARRSTRPSGVVRHWVETNRDRPLLCVLGTIARFTYNRKQVVRPPRQARSLEHPWPCRAGGVSLSGHLRHAVYRATNAGMETSATSKTVLVVLWLVCAVLVGLLIGRMSAK